MCVMTVRLSAAVRRNRATSEASEADVQLQLVRFMHGAHDREGGRRARQKRHKRRKGLSERGVIDSSDNTE